MTETYDFEHPTVALVRDIIKAGRCHGGEADPELGDRLCYTYDGREVDIYLDVSERRLDERGEPYDEALDDDEIIEHTVAVSDCGASRVEAAAVGSWEVERWRRRRLDEDWVPDCDSQTCATAEDALDAAEWMWRVECKRRPCDRVTVAWYRPNGEGDIIWDSEIDGAKEEETE